MVSSEYYIKLFVRKHQEHSCNLLATTLMTFSIILLYLYFRGCKYPNFIFDLQGSIKIFSQELILKRFGTAKYLK